MRTVTLLGLLSLLFILAPGNASASEKKEILDRCRGLFGVVVDKKESLFEADRFHVLHVSFDEKDNLAQLAIEPKYYYEDDHPGWEQSDDFENLTFARFQNFLISLDQIKEKGGLVEPAPHIGVVTNMTAWHTEVYERASLTYGVVAWQPDGKPVEIRWLRLDFGKPKPRKKIPVDGDIQFLPPPPPKPKQSN